MTGDSYRVEVIGSIDAFDACRDAWDDLHGASTDPLPFLRHGWLGIWWRHFGNGRDLHVLVARRGDSLAAALPLCRSSSAVGGVPLRTLESLSNDHSFRFAPLCRAGEEEALEAIWDHLRADARSWDLILLRDVAVEEGEARSTPLVPWAARDGHPHGVWKSYASPYLDRGGSWEEYLASLPAKFRSNLRNRAKRLAAEGEVSYRWLADAEVTDAILDACFELERRGWKGEEGSAIGCDPNLVSYYRAVAHDAAARGALRVSFLDVGGRATAFDLSLQEGARTYCLKIGYDPGMARFGPGQLLNERILTRGYAAGMTRYEFLGPLTEAKDAWRPRTHRHVWVYVFGKGVRARAAHAVKFTLRDALKRGNAS